jgi:hypothetical protein
MERSTDTSARTFKALRITTDEKLELIEISRDSALATLQGAVGGYIEVLGLAADLSLVLDEEGKLKGRPRNDIAIRLAQHFAVRLQPGDLIVGDVVLVGREVAPDEDGDDEEREGDVPDSVIELLARLGYPLS